MPSAIRITPALLLALASTTALANDDLLTRNTLTGDWGGLRRSARYSQNLKLGVQFDLTKLYGLQYIIEPGAFSGKDIDNALVVGLQVKATF